MVAPAGASHDAVSVPSARVTVTAPTAAGGVGAGGVYGPLAGEFRHPLPPAPFFARTPTTYVFALSASNVMLVTPFVVFASAGWSSAARLQLALPSEEYVTW